MSCLGLIGNAAIEVGGLPGGLLPGEAGGLSQAAFAHLGA